MKYFDFADHRLDQALEDLVAYVRHCVNVFDVGDIYMGTEELMGKFLGEYRKRCGSDGGY